MLDQSPELKRTGQNRIDMGSSAQASENYASLSDEFELSSGNIRCKEEAHYGAGP